MRIMSRMTRQTRRWRLDVAANIALNGMAAERSGYWTDRHGHRVYVCRNDVMPSCPRHPYATTRWRLEAAVACRHDQEDRRAA